MTRHRDASRAHTRPPDRDGLIGRRRLLRGGGALAAFGGVSAWVPIARAAPPSTPSAALVDATLPDFPIADGYHYGQASGDAGLGYEVRNIAGVAWWDAYRRLGGFRTIGYPVGHPYTWQGFEYQPFQSAVLQWSGADESLRPANLLESLDAAGHTEWLRQFKQVPRPIQDDGAVGFNDALRVRLGWLDDSSIRARFMNNPDPVRFVRWSRLDSVTRWGLPMSRPEAFGPFVAQRFQRGVLQHWVEEVAGAPSLGAVTPVLIGDLALEAGAIPPTARTPVSSAAAAETARGHTLGDRLAAAVAARLRGEPGRWAVFAAPLGGDPPVIELNADAVMIAASVWKAAAMLEAFRQRAAGELSFDQLLTMNVSVLERVEPPASLAPGQRVPVRVALERMLSISDNTTAIMLADRLRYARIDQSLHELGLASTTVNTRFPETTAREAARLLEVCVGARLATWQRSLDDALAMRDLLFSEQRADRIPARLPAGTPVAHKTGDLGGVVNDVGVIYASTGPYVVALLVQDSPDRDRSAATGAEISRIIFDALDPPSGKAEAPVG